MPTLLAGLAPEVLEVRVRPGAYEMRHNTFRNEKHPFLPVLEWEDRSMARRARHSGAVGGSPFRRRVTPRALGESKIPSDACRNLDDTLGHSEDSLRLWDALGIQCSGYSVCSTHHGESPYSVRA